MTLFQRILERVFAPVTLAPGSLERLKEAAAGGTLLYVARTLSLIEFLCWRYILSREGLPTPLVANGITKRATPDLFRRFLRSGRSVMFFLRKGRVSVPPQSFAGPYEEAFLRNSSKKAANKRPVVAVPLLLSWRDVPLREAASPPWIEAIIGAQEEPGPLRRLVQLLWRRSQVEAIVAEPLVLSDFEHEIQGLRAEAQVKRLRFHLSGAIERTRRARLGPRRKSARRIRQEILRSRRLARSIRDAARETGATDDARSRRRAERYLREIGAATQPYVLGFMRFMLSRIWPLIYEGIHVDRDGIDKVRTAARKGPLLIVPSHRSHVDYLIVSQKFADHGIAPPLIAAGANMAFFPMGFIFRRCGAFFLRRSFAGNRLYTAVFREYIRKVLHEGHSIEFFIEGGRSRTGKLLQPKFGLLGIIVEAVLEGDLKSVQVVPTSIAYDRVIEERAYAQELTGAKKKKEDFSAVLRAGRVLGSNYGRLYLTFDEPFELRQQLHVESPPDDEEGQRQLVRHLAYRILWGITRASVVTPTALVAAALLAPGRRGVARDDFLSHARFLARQAKAAQDAGVAGSLTPALLDRQGNLRDAALDRSIELLEDAGDIQIRGSERSPIYVVPEERRLQLDYYRNSALHALVSDALVATAISATRRAHEPSARARERAREVSRILKNEFVYEVGVSFDTIYDRTYQRLECGGTFDDPDRIDLLAGLVRDFLESYYVVATGLKVIGERCTNRDLMGLGERLYLEGVVKRREALSKANFDNALHAFRSGDVEPNAEAIAFFLGMS